MYSQENKNMVCVPLEDYNEMLISCKELNIVRGVLKEERDQYIDSSVLRLVLGLPKPERLTLTPGITEPKEGENNG